MGEVIGQGHNLLLIKLKDTWHIYIMKTAHGNKIVELLAFKGMLPEKKPCLLWN